MNRTTSYVADGEANEGDELKKETGVRNPKLYHMPCNLLIVVVISLVS